MSIETPSEGQAPERRREVLRLIAECRGAGALSLDEHASAVHRVQDATTPDEIDAVARALPPPIHVAAPGPRWIFSILGGTQQRGRWVVPSPLRLVCVLGGAELDLSRACVVGAEVRITCVVALGGLNLLVPAGVPVELSGFSLLGGRSDERRRGESLPGAPVVRLRVVSVLGGASVQEPGLGGVDLETAEDALVLRLGGLRALALRTRELRIPYDAIRAVHRGAADPAPATPFSVRQGERLAFFGDPDRAITLELTGFKLRERPVSEIAVEVADADWWLSGLRRDREAAAGGAT